METRYVEVHPTLAALREAHGFTPPTSGKRSASSWSKGLLAVGGEGLPSQQASWPKNAPILDELMARLASVGFRWRTESHRGKSRGPVVVHENYPTIGGHTPTLADLLRLEDLTIIDGFSQKAIPSDLRQLLGLKVDSFNTILDAMNTTGIGYKGMGEVSWLPSYRPFELPEGFAGRIERLARATFLFFDAVSACSGDRLVRGLIEHKRPRHIPNAIFEGPVDFVRPDIVLMCARETGKIIPKITELESAPAGLGMTHAVDLAYRGDTSAIDALAQYLGGRRFIVVATWQWAEYLRDIGLLCAALRERGVDANLVFDRPLHEIDELSRNGNPEGKFRWEVPPGAPDWVAKSWDPSFFSHLERSGFGSFVSGPEGLAEPVSSESVVFRFGYYDNLSAETLETLRSWAESGATIINGLHWRGENKSIMAALHVPAVRAWISARDPEALAVLDSGFAETRLLVTAGRDNPAMMSVEEACEDREYWLSKFGAWDGDNQSWGSRSLFVGSQHSAGSRAWQTELDRCAVLPHPVVLQHAISSERFSVCYVDHEGILRLAHDQRTRFTPFFLRRTGAPNFIGGMMTFRNSMRVHGATDAIDAPVVPGRIV